MSTIRQTPSRPERSAGRGRQVAPDAPAGSPPKRRRREIHDGSEGLPAPGARRAAAGGQRSRFPPPPTPARNVSRPRLLRRLQESEEASVILLAAPAGYGKSTLLSEWAQGQERPLAWLTLGPGDDEPALLLNRLTQALQELARAEPHTGAPDAARAGAASEDTPGAASESMPGAGDGDTAQRLGGLLACAASLGRLERRGVLVLDDVHNVRSEPCLRILSSLAAAGGASLQIALSSRSEPPLGLGRLRASGHLIQLGPDELEMTLYEARRLLAGAGLDLDEPDLAVLVDYTEGWAAALYLAAISLRSRPDIDAEPIDIVRDSQEIADYVSEELLSPLPGPSRAFLRRTSILERLSADLCDSVLQSDGSGARLQKLATRSLMLQPQHPGHGWYRCRSLVRDVLRFELELREPSELVRLHLRASAWFIAHGDSDAATDHAVAAGDPARAGTLLWAEGARCSSPADDRATRWLAAFTEEQLASSPQLALTEGYRCLAGGDARQAEHWARRVAAAVHGAGARTRSPALLASVAMLRSAGATGGIEQMHSEATRAYELLDESSHLRPLACLLRGVALELLGERDEARQALEAAVRLGGGPVAQVESLCLTQLALLDVAEGDWEQAGDHVLRASGSLAEHRLARHPTSAMTYAASALVHSQRGVADEAKRDLVSASRLLDDLGAYMPWHEVQTRIVMARACARLADVVRARALLSEASRWARRIERVEALVGALDAGWGEVDDLSASALSGPGSLTMAELRVLRFLPSHLSFREIGDRLHVSGNTVKTQAHAIYAKLGAGSRTEAVAQAAALGLIDVTIL